MRVRRFTLGDSGVVVQVVLEFDGDVELRWDHSDGSRYLSPDNSEVEKQLIKALFPPEPTIEQTKEVTENGS